MAKRFLNRKQRSIILANLIIENDLFDEWRIFAYSHPKIKSMYRLANLFALKKKFVYMVCEKPDFSLNCDNLLDRYYDDSNLIDFYQRNNEVSLPLGVKNA